MLQALPPRAEALPFARPFSRSICAPPARVSHQDHQTQSASRYPISGFPAFAIKALSSLSSFSISTSPEMSFKSVVLPQPFLPTIAIFSVFLISKIYTMQNDVVAKCDSAITYLVEHILSFHAYACCLIVSHNVVDKLCCSTSRNTTMAELPLVCLPAQLLV